MRQIVLDTETTGLRTEDNHRIIEIGCIELINRKFTGKRFHQYLNPQRAIDEGALNVHGITIEFLQNKPTFVDIVHEFIDFISDAELIIHNASFDVGFINYELGLAGKKWKSINESCRIIDTLLLARQLHTGQRNSLDALCKRYNIDNSHREMHGALLDAHLLAQVYLAMTGGQGTFFDELDVNEKIKTSNLLAVNHVNQPRKLCILEANSEEQALHQKILENINQKAKCLWLQEFVET